jgi:hypothetical protein
MSPAKVVEQPGGEYDYIIWYVKLSILWQKLGRYHHNSIQDGPPSFSESTNLISVKEETQAMW